MTTDTTPTTGQIRALDELAGPDGLIVGAAADHRDSLHRTLAARGIELDHDGVVELKLRILRALAPCATMVLIDVEHGAERALAEGVVPGDTGVAIPLEAQGYGGLHEIAQTELLGDVDPARVRRLGGCAAKLLLPYRIDEADQAARQDAVVEGVARACREAGVALVLEPVAYARPGETRAGAERFGELVVDGARRLAAFGPTVLKVQHPGSRAACMAMDEACGSIPWVLLGGGEPPEVLLAQVEDACRAGASGAIVGRTLFDEAVTADPAAAERALQEVSLPLLERLSGVVQEYGRPWRQR